MKNYGVLNFNGMQRLGCRTISAAEVIILLARSANFPEGLYILPMFFLYFLFFNGRLSSPRSSATNGAIFTKISGLVDR